MALARLILFKWKSRELGLVSLIYQPVLEAFPLVTPCIHSE
ncbi:hypothetical protein [Vibrio gallaecicus]|nr:hypothetical protein [Vibrio gallaecicus]MDN3616591.1 hypothetical protein [Vibrio gallaecicus]